MQLQESQIFSRERNQSTEGKEKTENSLQFKLCFRSRLVPISYAQNNLSLTRTLNDEHFDGVVGRLLTMTQYHNQNVDKKQSLRICKEMFSSVSVVIYGRKNFWFFDAINEKIEHLKSAGLIKFWHFKYIKESHKERHEFQEPKVLKLKHFQGSFVLLLCGFAMSLVAFIIEQSWCYLKLRRIV
jgi:hypothetical protein